MKVDLERKYYAKNKVLNVVFEEIKQRIKAKTTKLQKYNERNNNLYKTGLFQTNDKLLFEKIEGNSGKNDVKPIAEENRKFWSDFCTHNVEPNESPEWNSEVKFQVDYVPPYHVEAFLRNTDRAINGHIVREKLLPDELKDCRRQIRGTQDQLMIDKIIRKKLQRRMTNFGVAWTLDQKAYDIVPHICTLSASKFSRLLII